MVTSNGAPHARERKGRVLIAALLTMAVGCSEPTEPSRMLVPETASLAAGGNQRVKVKTFQLSANTLRIDGPPVTGTASFDNSGPAIPSGVSIQAVVQQGATAREAANQGVFCGGGSADVGSLPTGRCDMTFEAAVSNAGSGTLVPGPATMVLRVMQLTGGNLIELAAKSVAVNLVLSPGITTLSLAATTLAIDGPSTSHTATFNNPANSLQGITLDAYIRQGQNTFKTVSSVQVTCGGGVGVFPTGSCTMTIPAAARNSNVGIGTLVPGAAIFEVQLNQTTDAALTTFDIETIAITLVSSVPRIADLTLESTTFVIGGAAVGYTVQLANAGFQATDVRLDGRIEQDQVGGMVMKPAGFTYIDCGAGSGVLPNTGAGTCSIPFSASASASAISGTLMPGPARLVVTIYKAPPNFVPLPYDSRVIDVTLVADTPPSIVSMTPASNYVVLDLDNALTDLSVTLSNPGSALSLVLIQGEIHQGSAARAAGGSEITCGGVSGTLPSGGCVQQAWIGASNTAGGIGTLVPGPATFQLQLLYFDGVNTTVLDTKTISITLVANTPSIVDVTLESSTLEINGPRVSYSAVLYNPTGATLTGLIVKTRIEQGSASRDGGDASLGCSPALAGELPPGSCVIFSTVGASNSATGTGGAFMAGPATLRLELRQGQVLDTKLVPVMLISSP